MNLFHVEMIPKSNNDRSQGDKVHHGLRWEYKLPSQQETSVVLYIRKGSLLIAQRSIDDSAVNNDIEWKEISQYETCIFKRSEATIDSFFSIQLQTDSPCDFMLFTALPLKESIAASGTMVMNTNEEVQQAYLDYEQGKFGCLPWPHTLSDEQWTKHISQ